MRHRTLRRGLITISSSLQHVRLLVRSEVLENKHEEDGRGGLFVHLVTRSANFPYLTVCCDQCCDNSHSIVGDGGYLD